MSYISTNIANVVDRINRSYFLPAIQRPFVWQPDQIVALFDSLLKGYPISSFLLWEIKPERRNDWEIYKFIENFRFGDTHNELAEPDGRDVVLVLDGQQRLTSLLIGLRGSFTTRTKYARRNNPDAWSRQRLYIDLLKDPATENGDEDDREDLGVTYGLRFFETDPKSSPEKLWLKIGAILDCTSDDAFDGLKDSIIDALPDTATRGEQRIVEKNLDRLYRTIWKDGVISYYTEKDQSYDRVLDIFIRANDGGTKLSKSDLLLSMITSKWAGISARQEIFDFVDLLNDGLDGRNDLDKDFVMKSCLVLSDLDQRYKVGNFTNANLRIIEANWKGIKQSLEATLRLVNRFGIDRETLTSTNALLPIAYYVYKTRCGSLDGSTQFESSNAMAIRRWLAGSMLNGVFGGSSDQTIGASRSIIQQSLVHSRDFPYRGLVEGLARRGRLVNFDDNNVDGLLDVNYGQRGCFLALSLLYDTNNWGAVKYHIDHIIPRSLADRKALMAKNLPEALIEKILESVNRLGNLQLLLSRENLEKSNIPFSEWIQTRDRDFLHRHLIPDEPVLWEVEALPDFVRARERLIRQQLRRLSLDTAVFDATGQSTREAEGALGN
ncbi:MULTISPECIES: DUF262 domain-containing protein [Bradyrhizobium]|uniref:DUF262 domain-containing protein n=1 Tax=Bradyrhizobium elkanii TaxID=29448 RepID=A0A8I2C8Q1_BRAEL|nr:MULTISPECIES: DUF262 domain-containing protein [Bradyrhizobium]MBP1299334.1 hypothetical protein [Bradyrhizobium elkanii]MCP1929808.1 hypothetical protein [Bradyrhizobium elkanii]MCS3481935.1 hypothetical protein [Bradyrhizobium elkanii]MCS3579577.1 hypothetical protein [Bradyrhizobium elkanii]MCS3722448.1 hypothetical protein [Bradyrhizobium elkanii]